MNSPSKIGEAVIDLHRLTQGHKAEWDRFVLAVSPIIFALVERTFTQAGLDRSDVYDAVQEIFLHLCKNQFRVLKTYDPRRAKLSTWCGTIARHKAIDLLRQRRQSFVPLDELPETPIDFADPFPESLEIPDGLLSARQALIMQLIYEQDMEVHEVAALLSIEEQTVRSARHKALTKLRHFFNQRPS